ncbi:MAG: tetratricopeptide repeat protein [Actinomycetota bacterium]
MNVVLIAALALVAVAGLGAVGVFTRATRLMAVLLVLSFAFASVPSLMADEQRTAEASETPERQNPIDFFADRVAERPNNVSARLDLAAALLSAGNFQGAMTEYLSVLQLDPNNATAHARVALILFRGGLTKQALGAVDRSLEIQPQLPEALYVKGLITMMGLERPAEAKELFRTYLEVAPFGAYVADVERLLEMAR